MAVNFTRSQAERIARSVRKSEGSYTPDQRRGKVVPWQPGVLRAKCTTAIPAGTFDEPSDTGEVQIYHLNQSTGEWVESGDPVKCYNDHAFGDSEVGAGSTVKVCWISGLIWFLQADCPDEGPEE